MNISLSKRFTIRPTDRVWRMLFAAFAGALLITGGIYLVGTAKGIPLEHLTGDPAMITHTPIHIGILSNLGVMLWAAASACALLGAALQKGIPSKFRFLLVSGVFSAVLGIDDLLTIHEHFLPHYLHVPEMIGYLGYLLLAGIYLVSFIKEILSETDYPVVVTALLFFAISMIIPRIFPYSELEVFIKDSSKFFGIVYWLVYFFDTVIRFAKSGAESKKGSTAEVTR